MSVNKPIVVSGIQPSGELHLGNYLGALKNWLAIQNSGRYHCFFFIADYHSLTEEYDPAQKRDQIFELAVDYLALGLDPKKGVIFVQSQVPACAELAWIFNTITPLAELERMTQFKDKAGRQAKNINMGLFDYPVLQAADILLYGGQLVPVGEDQVQHLELTRDIARWFNNKYQTKFFPETKPLLTPTARIMSLAAPDKKMSKSLGAKHYLGIGEAPEEITQKIKKAASTAAGVENLRLIFDAFIEDMPAEFNPEKMSATKEVIAAGIARHFAEFRRRKEKLSGDNKYVNQVLERGRRQAEQVAQKTMATVKQIIGVA